MSIAARYRQHVAAHAQATGRPACTRRVGLRGRYAIAPKRFEGEVAVDEGSRLTTVSTGRPGEAQLTSLIEGRYHPKNPSRPFLTPASSSATSPPSALTTLPTSLPGFVAKMSFKPVNVSFLTPLLGCLNLSSTSSSVSPPAVVGSSAVATARARLPCPGSAMAVISTSKGLAVWSNSHLALNEVSVAFVGCCLPLPSFNFAFSHQHCGLWPTVMLTRKSAAFSRVFLVTLGMVDVRWRLDDANRQNSDNLAEILVPSSE